jgi:hypothetical protein
MNEHELRELREASWRRKLTPAEEAALQSHVAGRPEVRADGEADAALTHLLSQLPDAPLASNFTAQVLQAVERESVRPVRGRFAFGGVREWLGRLAPRVAWAAGLFVAALVIWKQYEVAQRGKIMAGMELMAGLEPVLQASALPDPKLLQDFDAIEQLTPLPPPADVELLHALSQ